MSAIFDLFTGGACSSIWQVFTIDEVLTFGVTSVGLLVIYAKQTIKQAKSKRIDKEYKQLENRNKERLVNPVQNIDISKMFK